MSEDALLAGKVALVTGAGRGVGKEVVARLIHNNGPRAAGAFVAVNCGAIPPELMESELFGHTKGSFTGANQDKIGLFQAAAGGSLFSGSYDATLRRWSIGDIDASGQRIAEGDPRIDR